MGAFQHGAALCGGKQEEKGASGVIELVPAQSGQTSNCRGTLLLQASELGLWACSSPGTLSRSRNHTASFRELPGDMVSVLRV